MAKNGFISNRMFDAAASGARIISDYVPGSSEIFGEALLEFRDVTELEDLLSSDMTSKFGSQIRIDEIASSIQREHNFDQRAQVLLNEASDFINLKN
jgi:spore maturation protein CgeB